MLAESACAVLMVHVNSSLDLDSNAATHVRLLPSDVAAIFN